MTDRPVTSPSESKAYRTSRGERLTTPWALGPLAHIGLKSIFGAWRSSTATRLMYADSGGRRPLGQWQEFAGTLGVGEAEASSGPEVVRRLFCALDEASYHLDSVAEPWSVHLEVRLSGTVVEDRLRQAVGVALTRHPRAHARATIARQRRAGYEWEITPAPDVDPLDVLQHLPLPAKRSIARLAASERVMPTAILSNLGRLDEDLDFGPELRAREVWFSPPTRMPMGLALGAVTAAGRLHLVFCYRHPLFGPADVAGFADRYVAALGHVAADARVEPTTLRGRSTIQRPGRDGTPIGAGSISTGRRPVTRSHDLPDQLDQPPGSPTGPTTSPRQDGGLRASSLTGTRQPGLRLPAARSTVRQ